jgi:hypothetical protein
LRAIMNSLTRPAPASNHQIPVSEIQIFRNLVLASGRDPAVFTAEVQPDGHVHVRGPRGNAFYTAGEWIPRFSRHLDKGFYDAGARAGLASAPEHGPRAEH